MRKTSMIVGSLFLLAVCTGCGKSDYAVTPENVALYAQGSSENSFFQLFDAARKRMGRQPIPWRNRTRWMDRMARSPFNLQTKAGRIATLPLCLKAKIT